MNRSEQLKKDLDRELKRMEELAKKSQEWLKKYGNKSSLSNGGWVSLPELSNRLHTPQNELRIALASARGICIRKDMAYIPPKMGIDSILYLLLITGLLAYTIAKVMP